MEEAILNPGAKPEVFPEDTRRDGDDDDDGGHDNRDYNEPAQQTEEVAATEMRDIGNTGPKGVLRDYQEAETRLRQKLILKQQELQEIAERNSHTVKSSREEDEENQIFERYREQRLKEMNEARRKKQQGQEGLEEGSIKSLGTYDYMEIVQEADPEQWIIIHIFKDSLSECSVVRSNMKKLARDHQEVGWFEISLEDALDSFTFDCLPVILVYKRGQPVFCHMTITGSLLCDTLVKDGVIEGVASSLFRSTNHKLSTNDENSNDEEDDEDD